MHFYWGVSARSRRRSSRRTRGVAAFSKEMAQYTDDISTDVTTLLDILKQAGRIIIAAGPQAIAIATVFRDLWRQ